MSLSSIIAGDLRALSIPTGEAVLVESRRHQIAEIVRVFAVRVGARHGTA